MWKKSSLAALSLALSLCWVDVGVAQAIDPNVLAKVVPGISRDQVKSLLGDPWRTVQYNDLDEVENEIWEYRGKDARGSYRVHIEFNRQGTVVIVGKIPDAAGSKGTSVKAAS